MSNKFRTHRDFEYDLWTSTDGKCYARIKASGETSEIDRETLRCLRNIEKQLRRTQEKEMNGENLRPLTFDELTDRDLKYIAVRRGEVGCEKVVMSKIVEEDLASLLTQKQLDVYIFCIKSGFSYSDYARKHGISERVVRMRVKAIRRKFEINFIDMV